MCVYRKAYYGEGMESLGELQYNTPCPLLDVGDNRLRGNVRQLVN